MYASYKLSDDKSVASHSSIVRVVIVGSIVCWFEIVTTIEEFANIGTAGSFDNELATWVIRGIVGSVNYQVIKEKKVALSLSGYCVEFILGHSGDGSPELLELTNVNLVTDFHQGPS